MLQNQFETNPKSIPENCYDRLDLFTILAQQSSLLPAQFNSIPHLVQRLSNAYHAYLVLLEVWKFYQVNCAHDSLNGPKILPGSKLVIYFLLNLSPTCDTFQNKRSRIGLSI